MSTKTYTTAVEFGTSRIACATARYDENESLPQLMGIGEVRYAGIERGKWVMPELVPGELARAVEQCETASGRKVREIKVGVPGCFTQIETASAEIEVNTRDKQIFPQHIERAMVHARRSIDVPSRMSLVASRPIMFHLSDGGYYLNPVGRRSPQLTAISSFAYADVMFLEDVRFMCAKLGLELLGFMPETFAQSVCLIPPAERDSGAILIDVGCNETTVCIVLGDAVVSQDTVYMGTGDIIRDLAAGLGLTYDDAEKLQRRYSFGLDCDCDDMSDYIRDAAGKLVKFDHAAVQKIVDGRVCNLAFVMYNIIQEASGPLTERSHLYITGSGPAQMRGGREYLQKTMGIPVAQTARTVSHPQYNETIVSLLWTDIASRDFVSERKARKKQ